MNCSNRRRRWLLLGLVCCAGLASPVIAHAGEPVRLTTDGLWKRDPVFWPGGKELIYSAAHEGGRMRLMRLNLETKAIQLFHPDPLQRGERELSVSADGTVNAYIRVHSMLISQIVVCNTKEGQTVSIGRADYYLHPTLSPDGRQVVFSTSANSLLAYDLRQAKGKDVQITPGEKQLPGMIKLPVADGCLWPCFSPDGRRIVYGSRQDNDFEIYVMNADGSDQRRLTRSPGLDMHPVFSPDGKQIAFTSARDGNREVYVMNADGSNVRRVTKHPERDEFPCWHPDGRRLVFLGERAGRFDFYLVDVP